MTLEAWILVGAQVFAVLYGLVIGSFLAATIVRIPEDRSLLVPSSCPRCGHRLGGADLVPVLSWLARRGRCRHCGTAISRLYPLVETLSALLAWLCFRHVVGSVGDLDAPHLIAWVFQYGFLCLLLVAAAVDVRHRIIPLETSSYAVPFGLAGHFVLERLGYDGHLSIGFVAALVGAVVWGGFFTVVERVWQFLTGRVGLGWGDVKLAWMLGAFLGVAQGGAAIMLGSIVGSVVGIAARVVLPRNPYLPFGPPLALGATVVVLFGDLPLTEWLVDLFYA